MVTKILFGWLVVVVVFVTGNTFAQSINYYFDAANGNDNNTGTSAAKSFKTFKKLSQLRVNGGDSILLKSGVIFTGSLFFSGKGLPGKPIVIGKYGGIAKPHLKAMLPVYKWYIFLIQKILLSVTWKFLIKEKTSVHT